MSMNLGPILQRSVATIIPLAHERYGTPIVETPDGDSGDSFASWLWHDAIPEHVPADDKHIIKLIKDTPDLLVYCIAFDDLYPMEAVTPGWYIGEAAYRTVYDTMREQLGLAQEPPPSW